MSLPVCLCSSKAVNKLFVYNHKQSEWRELAGMKTPRAMFGAVVHNGKIIVIGGVNEEGLTASSEIYDFTTNKYIGHDSNHLSVLKIADVPDVCCGTWQNIHCIVDIH